MPQSHFLLLWKKRSLSLLSNDVVMNNRLKDLYSKFLASQRFPKSVLNVFIYIRNSALNTYWIFKRRNYEFYNHIRRHSKYTQRSVAPILYFPLVLQEIPSDVPHHRWPSKLMHKCHPASNLRIRRPFWRWISIVLSVRPQQYQSAQNFLRNFGNIQSSGSKTTASHWIHLFRKQTKTLCAQ